METPGSACAFSLLIVVHFNSERSKFVKEDEPGGKQGGNSSASIYPGQDGDESSQCG